MAGPSPVDALTYSTLQLKPIYGVKLKIVNDGGIEQPRTQSFGSLIVSGPWVTMSYFKNKGCSDFTGDGWFDTGGISTSGENEYMHIVDRAKDVIKLGGR
jgi:acyl-CoA synthetase (AMP-forming)/AMP-acid ligase II